jgi:hypothetical protein
MAGSYTFPTTTAPIAAPESDYGSDLDDTIVDELLSQAKSPRSHETVVTSIESQDPQETVIISVEDSILQDAPPSIQRSIHFHNVGTRLDGPIRAPSIEIEYDERNRTAFSREYDACPSRY